MASGSRGIHIIKWFERGQLRQADRGFLSGNCPTRSVRWSEGEAGLVVECERQRLRLEAYHRIAVPLNYFQVGVGAPYFDLELGPHFGRLGAGEAAFSGAEPHQDELVVLGALQLERPSVGPVGHDGLTQLRQRQRPVKSGGIRGSKVPNDLPEEAIQVGHSLSRQPAGRSARWRGWLCPDPTRRGPSAIAETKGCRPLPRSRA